MKIKELEEALKVSSTSEYDTESTAGVIGAVYCESMEDARLIKEAAKTMLDLMKARESATGGEWVLGTHPANHKLNIIKPLCMRDNIGKLPECEGSHAFIKHDGNAKFITLAANITRETN